MLRISTYSLLVGNMLLAGYGIFQLGVEIGQSWYSAGPFYFAWSVIPLVLLHFGLSRFGTVSASQVPLFTGAVITFTLTAFVVWTFIIAGPIGPFSMLVFMPLPLTQLILVTPLIWYARRIQLRNLNR